MKRTAPHRIPLIAVGAVVMMALAGCSATSSGSGASSAAVPAAMKTVATKGKVDSSWMNHLPENVKSKGTIDVATTDANAPWSFFDGSTPKGVDVDLIDAAAKKLGLKVSWSNVQFTAGIPGVQSGRFDMYRSAMADSKAREQIVDFIDYSKEGSGVIVKKGNPEHITKWSDLCGKTISIVTGSIFPTTIDQLNSTTCKSDPAKYVQTADQTAPMLAVASGQADATMNTYGVSNYMFKTATSGVETQLQMSPIPLFAPAYQGIAFDTGNAQFLNAFAGAMQSMVEDGSYQKIMAKWGVSAGALKQITTNTATF